jgi:hypothetical protein
VQQQRQAQAEQSQRSRDTENRRDPGHDRQQDAAAMRQGRRDRQQPSAAQQQGEPDRQQEAATPQRQSDQRHRGPDPGQANRAGREGGNRGGPAPGGRRWSAPSRSEQQSLVAQQRRQAGQYQRDLANREARARQHSQSLQRQHRRSQYAYQQRYYDLLRRQGQNNDWQNYDYYADPYFSSAPTYRYYRGGSYYAVNQFAARLLRQAVEYGYREGIRAGRADEQDGWRFDYRNSFAYMDANYGYRGFYVRQSEYNYYFREGFRRGYEDGFYGRREYGRYSNGSDDILSSVMSLVLDLQPYDGGYDQGYYDNGY